MLFPFKEGEHALFQSDAGVHFLEDLAGFSKSPDAILGIQSLICTHAMMKFMDNVGCFHQLNPAGEDEFLSQAVSVFLFVFAHMISNHMSSSFRIFCKPRQSESVEKVASKSKYETSHLISKDGKVVISLFLQKKTEYMI